MDTRIIGALCTRRPRIRAQWEALLRVEPVTTPLGHPDSLVHLIEHTLDDIFIGLVDLPEAGSGNDPRPLCPCGRSPFLTYFSAGEQALHEALILAQAASAPLDPADRDTSFEEVNRVLRAIARRDIETFCGICRYNRSELAAASPST